MDIRLKASLAILFLLGLGGCAVNGKHLYVDGKCISCWQNPLANEPLQDTTAAAGAGAAVLNWADLAFSELKLKKVSGYAGYADAYLRFKHGRNYSQLKTNEIRHRQELLEAAEELRRQVQAVNVFRTYQVTLPQVVDAYDFGEGTFPIRHPAFVEITPANVPGDQLPQKMFVKFSNAGKLPSWQMLESEADFFLQKRRGGRGIYVRYLMEINEYLGAGSFSAEITEVQFIDVKPSIVTRHQKEELQPAKVVSLR